MKRKLLWCTGLFFAFLLLLLVTAPATLVTRTASAMVPGLGFSGVSGSLWRGEAALMRFGAVALPNAKWQLSPWQLLLGKAAVQIEFGEADRAGSHGTGKLSASLTGVISAEELSVQLPAGALQPLIKMAGVQFVGALQLDLMQAIIADQKIQQLQGRLIWTDAQVRTPLGQPMLGAYAVDLGTDGEGGMIGDISDVGGVLGLTGRFQLNRQRLELNASVRSDLPEELDRFFRVVGRPDGDRYALRWQQNFAN